MIAANATKSSLADLEYVEPCMEHLPGYDFSKLVRTSGPLPVAEACRYVQQAANELQAAHEKGAADREIKPSDLLPHRKGKTLGTLDCIAPERIQDPESADARSDVYALGCMLYFLLTGKTPFSASSSDELLRQHREVNATPLHLVQPDVPVDLAVLVTWMMAKDQDRRFQTPAEVVRALAPFVKPVFAGPSPGSIAKKPMDRRNKRAT